MDRLMYINNMLIRAAFLLLGIIGAAQATPIANPANVDFGLVGINTRSTLPITITVDNGFSVSLASGGQSSPFSFDFSSCLVPGGGGFVGPGTCTVEESYTPTSFTTSHDALSIFECPVAGGHCLSVDIPITGTGISLFKANPSSVDFGLVPINTRSTVPINLTIDSGFMVSLASGGQSSPFGFDFSSCLVPAGGGFRGPGNCSVEESYTPTSFTTSHDTLSVFECPIAGGHCLDVSIPLSGTGSSLSVPEPGILALLGLAGLAAWRTKRRTTGSAWGQGSLGVKS